MNAIKNVDGGTDRGGAGAWLGLGSWLCLWLTRCHALPELAKRGKPVDRGGLWGGCVGIGAHDLLCSGGWGGCPKGRVGVACSRVTVAYAHRLHV